jgi:4,5-dihydroxyphthalate decarboxylase
MKADLELKFSIADYHRTRPLLNGSVKLEGIKPAFHAAAPGEACLRPVYEEFDVAEMSLSWYVMARSRNEPVHALPIFPLRMFIQAYIYCGANSAIREPRDLIGKRVGMDLYRLTVGLWARGILQERYGVMPSQIHWITSEPEGAGFQVPTDVRVTIANEDVEAMLLRGDVDAVISPNVPRSFRAGDPRIRRLFQPCRPAIEQYFADTAIFPITHTVVVREALLQREPWIVDRLVNAFDAADAACRREYDYPKRLSFPTAALILEEEERRFGKNPWQHGLAPNAHTLEKFMQYAASQGYTPRALSIEEAFWPGIRRPVSQPLRDPRGAPSVLGQLAALEPIEVERP